MSERNRKIFTKIVKRNGDVVPSNIDKISQAIYKSMLSVQDRSSFKDAEKLAKKVMEDLSKVYGENDIPSVEAIQDEVERQLILSDYVAVAKSYIIYRSERTKLRKNALAIPEKVKKLIKESEKYFIDNKFGEFVYLRTYARWIEKENRRESWIETVQRYMDFMKENLGDKLSEVEYQEIHNAILNQEAMPSMRLMQFSGKAARRCNAVIYNCAFNPPDTIKDFADNIYLSMSGCGIGFSVENYNVQKLPIIQKQTGTKLEVHVIQDSKEGWADAYKIGLETWYSGLDIDFDFSKIRSAGSRLKTMGGKSSGPDPLRDLLNFTKFIILLKQGRRLSTIDVHDIMCKIAEIVVTGGVRRVALISLSDLDDSKMRDAKKGHFYYKYPQRSMANNSAVYESKPTAVDFFNEMAALINSGTGERGIFNRSSLRKTMPERRIKYLLEKYKVDIGPLGVNPCGEIILQPKQFCNLSEVVARSGDTKDDILRKLRIATILGTYQTTLNKFNYISEEWSKNNAEERLLGVSITGQWDSEVVRDAENLSLFREEVIKQNKIYAKRFGIKESNAVTAVKPSGTLSSVVNAASGMHARHSKYYIRRVRMSSTDPLFKMVRDQGIIYNPEVGQTKGNATTFVVDFPVKAPEGSIFSEDLTAMDQLEHWKKVKINYTEHNPSVTISVADDEWVDVAHWVYSNWDIVGGLSFLPRDNYVYKLAPYEAINKEKYEELLLTVKNLDFSKLPLYEVEDTTDIKKEMACTGGACEMDI